MTSDSPGFSLDEPMPLLRTLDLLFNRQIASGSSCQSLAKAAPNTTSVDAWAMTRRKRSMRYYDTSRFASVGAAIEGASLYMRMTIWPCPTAAPALIAAVRKTTSPISSWVAPAALAIFV